MLPNNKNGKCESEKYGTSSAATDLPLSLTDTLSTQVKFGAGKREKIHVRKYAKSNKFSLKKFLFTQSIQEW